MTPDLTPFNAAAAEALAVYDYGGIGTWLGLDNSTRVGHIAYWTPVAEVAVAAVYELIAAQVREEAQAALREAQAAVALQAETMGDAIATIDRLRQIAARDDGLCLVDCDTHIIAVPRAADGEASLACPQCRNDALLPALAEARAALAQVREDVARRIEAEAESAGRHGHHNARLNLLTAAYIAREGTQTEAPPRRSVPMTQDKGQATDSPDPDAPLRIETTEGRASDPRPDWLKRQEPDPRIASVALAVASSYEWARIAVEALDRYDADNSPASRDAKWIRFHDADLGERIAQAIDQAWAVTKDRVKPDGCDEYLDGYLAGLEYAEGLARSTPLTEAGEES